MSDVSIKEELTVDLLDMGEPALSATSDIPVIETKPDSQAKPEAKTESKPAPEEAKAKDAAPSSEPDGKKPEESATPDTPDEDPAASDEPEKPKAKGVQKRIDELVKQREEEKAEKLRLLAIVEGYNKPKQEPEAKPTETDPEPQRPDRSAFADITAYEEALANYADSKASWSAKHAVQEALAAEAQKTEQRQIAEGQRLAREAYAQRIEKATEKYPDYKQVAESPDVMVSMPMAHAILHSEHGPELQYHLGKNPEEAKRIALLSPPLQLMEMGLIVARLTAPAAKETPAPQKPAISAAPKPIKPLETKGNQSEKTPENMTTEEYIDFARKRDAAEKRSGART